MWDGDPKTWANVGRQHFDTSIWRSALNFSSQNGEPNWLNASRGRLLWVTSALWTTFLFFLELSRTLFVRLIYQSDTLSPPTWTGVSWSLIEYLDCYLSKSSWIDVAISSYLTLFHFILNFSHIHSKSGPRSLYYFVLLLWYFLGCLLHIWDQTIKFANMLQWCC